MKLPFRYLGCEVAGEDSEKSVLMNNTDLQGVLGTNRRPVYVIDDDEGIRESLTFLMATRDLDVHAFESGLAFFEQLSGLSSGPIILDIRMPQMDGIEFLEQLARRAIAWPVLALSGHGEIGVAVQAIKLGAVDFLEKPVKPIQLEMCLAQAFKKLEDDQASQDSRATSLHSLALLTPRESDVLAGLCSGKANKQVAFALSISPRTVEMHRANALRRLGVRTIAEVVALINAAKAN